MPPEPQVPPPLYSQHEEPFPGSNGPEASDVQILIVPAVDGTSFQKGYLGAEGEHAAIEGEIHLKGVQPRLWKKVSVALLLTIQDAHRNKRTKGLSLCGPPRPPVACRLN